MSKFQQYPFSDGTRMNYVSLKDIYGDFEDFLNRTEMPEPLHNTPQVIKRMGDEWLKHYKAMHERQVIPLKASAEGERKALELQERWKKLRIL